MLDVKKMGKQIAYVRMRNNCTQEQLAEVLGVSSQTVSKWENGKVVPEAFILCGRSKLFHCSIDSILDPLAWSLCEIDFDYEFLVMPRVPIADYSGSEWPKSISTVSFLTALKRNIQTRFLPLAFPIKERC